MDLMSALLDVHSHRLVWSDAEAERVKHYFDLIGLMVDASATYTTATAVAALQNELPALFAPPRSDYYFEKVALKTATL